MRSSSRRSSLAGSQHSISSRRSSNNLKESDRIQIANAQRRRNVPPQILFCVLCGSPIFVFVYSFAIEQCEASVFELISKLWAEEGVFDRIFASPLSPAAWKIIVFVVLIQLIFCLTLPRDTVHVLNSTVFAGQRESRSVNSFYSCLLLILLYVFGAALGFYKGAVIFMNWTHILSILTVMSILAVTLLYARQRHKVECDPIADMCFGKELTPVIYTLDLKHFITYRFSRTIWPLYIVSALYYNHSVFGVLNSFFRIWGTLVFFPALYVTPVTLLAQQKKAALPLPLCALFAAVGICANYLTAKIDEQRIRFRLTNGNMKVWGEDPYFITAKYRRENGEIAANLLLGSGWWGLCRHPNYSAEWITFASWTALQGVYTFFSTFPIVFLAVFLHFRVLRDELS